MRYPSPSWPSIRSGVSSMSSNTSCAVSEARWPELVLEPRHPVTGGVGRHDKGADAFAAGGRVGDGEDDRDLRVLARR